MRRSTLGGRSTRERACRGCGTCHDRLDVIGEIDWPRLTSWINIGRGRKGGRLPRFEAVNWPRRICNAMDSRRLFLRSLSSFSWILSLRAMEMLGQIVAFYFIIGFAADSSDPIKGYLRSKLVGYTRTIVENFSVISLSKRLESWEFYSFEQ